MVSSTAKIAFLWLGLGVAGSVLLSLGAARGILSSREAIIATLVWSIGLCASVVILGRRAAKKYGVPRGALQPALDDATRRFLLRAIWRRKVWIGVLAVLLPIGIANGAAHRAWLPTLAGAGMSLLWIYVSIQAIKRLRKSLR